MKKIKKAKKIKNIKKHSSILIGVLIILIASTALIWSTINNQNTTNTTPTPASTPAPPTNPEILNPSPGAKTVPIQTFTPNPVTNQVYTDDTYEFQVLTISNYVKENQERISLIPTLRITALGCNETICKKEAIRYRIDTPSQKDLVINDPFDHANQPIKDKQLKVGDSLTFPFRFNLPKDVTQFTMTFWTQANPNHSSTFNYTVDQLPVAH